MKKVLVIFIVGLLVAMACGIDAYAAKKSSKKSGLPEATIQQMSDDIDRLTKKMYGNALFSPQDNETLIDVKIKLDNQMLISPDATLAPLYYKAGVLYKSREMKSEAIECFQTILENFKDTALAPKAIQQLESLGVVIKQDVTDEESEEEE